MLRRAREPRRNESRGLPSHFGVRTRRFRTLGSGAAEGNGARQRAAVVSIVTNRVPC
jgi:hypothetical protein